MSSHIVHSSAEKGWTAAFGRDGSVENTGSSVERGCEGTAASSRQSTAWWEYSTDTTQRDPAWPLLSPAAAAYTGAQGRLRPLQWLRYKKIVMLVSLPD